MTSVKEYGFTTGILTGAPVTTTSFGYDRDKLTSFGGTTIAYNAIGCPTTYDGKSATWTRGKLSALSKGSRAEGLETYSFAYNALGQRVSKSYSYLAGTSGMNPVYSGQLLSSSKQFYYDHSGRLIAETTAKNYHGTGAENEKIVFLYDGNTIIGMQYTTGGVTTPYYFHRNPLGDVIGIYNTNGTLVAQYIYDAWGNCTISGNSAVANANPIRYRGYYYDEETGLYYCNARYYSPKWRRFISPDDAAYLDPSSVNGLNQYCYCNNDPINYTDPSGRMPEWLSNTLKVIGAIGIVVGVTALTVATAGVAAYLLGASATMIGAVTAGAAIGGLVAGGLEIGAQIYENGIDGMNLGAIAIESFSGAAYGAITGVSSTATSAALRLGMRGARVALGGLSTALHGINNGDSVGTVLSNVGRSVTFGILLQGALAGMDAYTGKLSTSILQLYKLDGVLAFGAKDLLLMIALLTSKSAWRN